jgi:xanthine dehydrogenase accessory factor
LSVNKILAVIRGEWADKKIPVLATVVSVEGSSYRAPGAVLLVDSSQAYLGMISGGCLEPAIMEIARTLGTRKGVLRWFDLKDDSVWGLGMGCGGMVGVYLEPICEDRNWSLWVRAIEKKEAVGRVVVYETENSSISEGSTLVTSDRGMSIGTTGNSELDSRLRAELKILMGQPESVSRDIKIGPVRALLDVVWPPPRLVIFGAGGDAMPVADLAVKTGFKTLIVDDRQELATKQRFPVANLNHSTSEEYPDLDLGGQDYVVIMHHHLGKDAAALKTALNARVYYVGLLGPESRFEKIKRHIVNQGQDLEASDIARIDTPIGLDIGAQGPDEIALSIVSGLLAVRRLGRKDRLL